MGILTKSLFIASIEAIRQQVLKDRNNAISIAEIYNTDCSGTYDNSLLIKAIITLLQVEFPRSKEGFCEIEHYCFDMNFGKIGSDEVITIEDLWFQLNPLVSTHPLID